ncbi:MAG: NAD(P)-dependent oxidoreductase [Campylobacter sp.]|nr:NAD(P)-dependent oxidoreductase [Campylobacter sp.]
MKAIVTGATGGLGRHLTSTLLEHGWEVLAFGRNTKIGKNLATNFVAFDLSDTKATLQAWQSTDIVFHCAALSSPWGKFSDFEAANIKATQNAILAAEQMGCERFIHVSTPSIYFDFTDHINVKENYVAKNFANHYAASKFQAENCIANAKLKSIIIRPRGLFGEYDTALLPRLTRLAQKGFLPLIKRKNRQAGDALIDTTYIGNVVLAMMAATTCQIPSKTSSDNLFFKNKTPVFNISNNEPKTIKEIFLMISEILHWDIRFKNVSYGLLDTAAKIMEIFSPYNKEPILTRYSAGVCAFDQTLNITAAQKYLNYNPIFSLSEGLERYAKYIATKH